MIIVNVKIVISYEIGNGIDQKTIIDTFNNEKSQTLPSITIFISIIFHA